MKKLIIGMFFVGTTSAFASGSIVGFGVYGYLRSLGPETIKAITEQIKIECLENRNGELESKVECVKIEDKQIWRICSATCSRGGNLFITRQGERIPKVKK